MWTSAITFHRTLRKDALNRPFQLQPWRFSLADRLHVGFNVVGGLRPEVLDHETLASSSHPHPSSTVDFGLAVVLVAAAKDGVWTLRRAISRRADGTYQSFHVTLEGGSDFGRQVVVGCVGTKKSLALKIVLVFVEALQLVGLDGPRKRHLREVDVDRDPTVACPLDLFDSSRYGSARRCTQARVEQSDNDVALIDKLPVDDGLSIRSQLRNRIGFPAQRDKDDTLASGSVAIPAGDRALDGIARICGVAGRGDQHRKGSRFEWHRTIIASAGQIVLSLSQ